MMYGKQECGTCGHIRDMHYAKVGEERTGCVGPSGIVGPSCSKLCSEFTEPKEAEDVRAYSDRDGSVWRKTADGKWLCGIDAWRNSRNPDGTCKLGHGYKLEAIQEMFGPLTAVPFTEPEKQAAEVHVSNAEPMFVRTFNESFEPDTHTVVQLRETSDQWARVYEVESDEETDTYWILCRTVDEKLSYESTHVLKLSGLDVVIVGTVEKEG